jgi:transcriptional regulator with XRE-family HTH domain
MAPNGSDREIDDFYVTVGSKVRSMRINVGISQMMLAKRIGFTRSSVANLEAGRQRVALHLFVRIAHALGSDPCQLLPQDRTVSSSDVLRGVRKQLAHESDRSQEFVRGAVAQLVSDSES